MHAIWGPIEAVYRSHAMDDAIRDRAAAGGTLTALGCFLLQSRKVDAIVHVKASSEQPMLTDCHVSYTPDDVISGSQSRYGPSPALTRLCEIVDTGARIAVIAKPCDITAVRNLMRVDARASRQILYCLTLFCGGVPTIQTSEKVVLFHGFSPSDLKTFRWRGYGWPGHTYIESADGRTAKMSYEDTWHKPGVPWSNDVQFRCKICPDSIGELADVSCPDGWVLENGKPIYREAPGLNIAIARTEKGHALLREAHQAGFVGLGPCEQEELAPMHRGHLNKKLQVPARYFALWLMRKPRLKLRNYRMLTLLRLAGPAMVWGEFTGMLARIRDGRNRENPKG
ncbi:Coenzyme F420 hydrogenase/dehydrogenase, beta subunit C-terminal domain [Mesorhizobium shangrilense]|uniref:Coenzyme F420 hydrogenase/dehydrogenase, beta subunit C-terminal domain n=1 Tax=Mesorhizobium shangrilense TaxID=460060 RepID=A0ABV2DGX7_9HYPH